MLKEVLLLLKIGDVEVRKERSYLLLFLKIFIVFTFFKYLSFAIVFYLDNIGLIEKPKNLTGNKLRSISLNIKMLYMLIYAPVVEEMAFRLGLKFSRLNFVVFFSFLCLVTLNSIFRVDFTYSVPFSILLGILLYLILKPSIIKSLSYFWNNNKRLILYLSLFLFTVIHIGNYDITLNVIILSPLFLMSHFIGGVFYSYTRFKIGIIGAILLHLCNNGLIPLIKLIIDLFIKAFILK